MALAFSVRAQSERAAEGARAPSPHGATRAPTGPAPDSCRLPRRPP